MTLAYDYPLLGVFWSMFWFFMWVLWFIILFRIIVDIFRSHDMGGFVKALWLLFVILLPFLGVLIYIGINGRHMAERNMKDAQTMAEFAEYQRAGGGGGGATKQIADAKALLDSGAIDQAEFEKLKAQALAA